MRMVPVLVLALGLAACGPRSNNQAATENTATPAPRPTVVRLTTPDFITQAAASDMYEVQAAKVALEHTQSPEVRAFAEMLIKDHEASTHKLGAIIGRLHFGPPPGALDDAHARMIASLGAATPDHFDTVYLDQQTKAHEEALTMLRNYAESGDNADLRTFANEMIPTVQGHLDRARTLDHAGADDQAPAKP